MYCLNVWLTVKDPANIDTITKLLTQQVHLSREEPGCLRFGEHIIRKPIRSDSCWSSGGAKSPTGKHIEQAKR